MASDTKQPAMTLDEYLHKWSLHSPVEMAKTPTSRVYKVSSGRGVAALKLLTELGRTDERFAPSALRSFGGNGAVRIYASDEFAHLLEFVDGGDLSRIVDDSQDFEATRIICATLSKLHQAELSEDLPGLAQRFSALRARINGERDTNPVLDDLCRAAGSILDALLASEQEKAVLHGDMHHENILYHKARGWIAIDPKGLYGDRAYDVANLFLNPCGRDNLVLNETRVFDLANVIASEMALDRDRVLKFAYVHACLSACWSVEDEESPDRAIAMARLIRNRHGVMTRSI